MAGEAWLAVPGYVGVYEVSDRGRTRSLDKVVSCGLGRTRLYRGQLLKSVPNIRDGRLTVVLCDKGVGHRYYVAHLVLLAFVGPCPPGKECCHGDGNDHNNYLANLRWDTESSNTFDQVRHGTHNNSRRLCCLRGHKFKAPNLAAWALKRNVRVCLACVRGRDELTRSYVAWTEADMQRVSDGHYRRLMSTV